MKKLEAGSFSFYKFCWKYQKQIWPENAIYIWTVLNNDTITTPTKTSTKLRGCGRGAPRRDPLQLGIWPPPDSHQLVGRGASPSAAPTE